jgi:hypothetical protein
MAGTYENLVAEVRRQENQKAAQERYIETLKGKIEWFLAPFLKLDEQLNLSKKQILVLIEEGVVHSELSSDGAKFEVEIMSFWENIFPFFATDAKFNFVCSNDFANFQVQCYYFHNELLFQIWDRDGWG